MEYKFVVRINTRDELNVVAYSSFDKIKAQKALEILQKNGHPEAQKTVERVKKPGHHKVRGYKRRIR